MDDEDSDGSFILTSVLFGNIGQEVGNVFDETTLNQLSNFASVLCESDIIEKDECRVEPGSSVVTKREDAVDYYDIAEFAEDYSINRYSSMLQRGNEDEVDSDQVSWQDDFHPRALSDSGEESDSEEAPLANMLPEEYRDFDVCKLFPEFKKNKILRFSRLFGPGKPTSQPLIWRSVKSKRKGKFEQRLDEQETKSIEDEPIAPSMGKMHLDYAPTPPLEECANYDEITLLNPPEKDANVRAHETEEESNIPPWRYGPAAYWYNKMNVPPTGEGFNYNMRLKPGKETERFTTQNVGTLRPELLPVNINRWEDDIIIDQEGLEDEVKKMLTCGQQPTCGWIPTPQTRDMDTFMTMLRSNGFTNLFTPKWNTAVTMAEKILTETSYSQSYSVFPPENCRLIDDRWEDNVIIDPDNMDRIPEPSVVELDPTDVPDLFGLPEDEAKEEAGSAVSVAPETGQEAKGNERKVRCAEIPQSPMGALIQEHQFTRKSQMILGRVVQRKREEDEEVIATQMREKDPFNLSNDEYYLPKGTSSHSIPAQNLMRPFFPTFFNLFKLRHFHRMPLRRYGRGTLSRCGFHVVYSLEAHISEKKQVANAFYLRSDSICSFLKQREEERIASGGGDMFYMREPDDLSGKDGDLIFVEFSEEHPPLLCQPGMASKIKIYNKRRPGKETVEPHFEYGETAYTHTSPFLGSLLPGQSLQALENNLFRAPIYQHVVPDTDFLVIRTRNGYSIRKVQTIFCVGQELPLFEVPSPNSKRASNFVRDFLLVFIYRLFWESTTEPRRIRMEDVRRAFPHYAESSIRKRLKICSDFKRLGQGPDANFWVLRDDFRLPNLEELRLLISPELCCSYYSMLAAEQRLKDAGYGEKYFFTPEDDEEDDGQAKMADEIKCAPWNTTRAYIAATKGKCLLDVTGVADPTGCGEGYSFVRLSSKPPKEDLPPPVKKTVTGTDADLRKLSLKDAKQLLRDFGVKDEEIKSLTRWEIIDVIRTLSTQQARAGGTGITKFARGSMRFSVTEVQERYKQDCQRIFELQNSVLSSTEVLSTDNEESEADDSDIEEIGKNIESMLTMKKSSYSNEEKEREELQKLLRGESFMLPGELKKTSDSSSQIAARDSATSLEGRKLKITRSYRSSDGREHITVEYVTKPQLIEAYVKIRTTKDETFIKHFAHMDEQYREERRREKRRLQDQLRRIRRNEMKAKLGIPLGSKAKPTKSSKPPPPPKPSLLKMRCSACGAKGHMKTNKNCPLYGKVKYYAQSLAVPDDVEMDEELKMPKTEKNLVSVEGTKVKLSKLVVEHAEKLRKAMRSKAKGFANKIIIRRQSGDARLEDEWTPKGTSKGSVYSFDDSEEEEELDEAALSDSNSRLRDVGSYTEYFDGIPKQGVHRRRTDPKISMSAILEGVLNEVRALPEAGLFLQPVSKKLVPDYYKVINRPIDLQKVRMNVAQNQYVTREEFLRDIRQILDNSRLYNGDQSEITQAARQVFLCASRKVAEKERRLMKLEKAINPLLDDNDQVAFSYLLSNIIQQCKCLPKTFPFYQPVDGRKVKSYYEKVKFPMDLGTMEQKAQRHQYHFLADFLSDVEQIYKNSELFNGPASMFTTKAKEIFDCACRLVEENKGQLLELEGALNLSRQKVLDAAESESLATGVSSSYGSLVRDEAAERTGEAADSRLVSRVPPVKEDAKLQLDLLLSDSEGETNGNKSPLGVPAQRIHSANASCPEGLILVSDFVTDSQEQDLSKLVESYAASCYCLGKRKVLHFGYNFLYSTNEPDISKPAEQPIPPLCLELTKRMRSLHLIEQLPNQLTVNFYEPGQGIPLHFDSSPFIGKEIVSLSLNGDIVMDFVKPLTNCHYSLLLPRRSLLIMTGQARYEWKHGIAPRKYDVLPNGMLLRRSLRVSFTFRYVSDSQERAHPVKDCQIPTSTTTISNVEEKYVYQVYDQIAVSFDRTRYSLWPGVLRFLDGLKENCLLLDVGCGNGKYLSYRADTIKIGCDRSLELCKICRRKGYQVLQADCRNIPFRDETFDAVLSIAVIHHLSTTERRIQALNQLIRVLRPGGRALVYVWAAEQTRNNEDSKYLKSHRFEQLPQESSANEELPFIVHKNRRPFEAPDLLVPWKSAKKSGEALCDESEKPILRYYHVFADGELETLCRSLTSCTLLKSYYEQGNWCAILERC
ncbi:hypothetical protein M514_10706, partial [Trichuris suis]